MNAPIRWLSLRMVEAFHAESLSRFGGASGVRDMGLLESALARPQNAAAYEPDAAALYCIGIIKNHPFIDGNKRTGLLAGRVFLSLNGYRFAPNEVQTVLMILAAAASEIDEAALAKWFADNSAPK